MDYIPFNPAYDPLGLALGQGMGQGMMQQGQQQQWQQLLAALSGQPYQGRQGGINLPLLGNIGGRQVNYPATQGMNMQALGGLRDPQMQQMAMQILGQQMQSPLQQAQTEQVRAETQMLGQPDISKMQQTATTLRKEFDTLSAPYRTIRDSYSRVLAAADDPSAAGDLAIIFNYMKILDPGSVVRESEFATAENAAGVPDKIRNLWNKALTGERITYNRKDFINTAKKLYQSQEKIHKGLIKRYEGLSKRWDIAPEDVITEPFIPAGAQSRPMQVKTIQEAFALPVGTQFIDPNGILRTR